MLTISNRECLLGGKYSGRDVDTDDVKFKSLKFELSEIELDEAELCALLGEPHAYRALYNTDAKGGVAPYLKCFKGLELKSAWEGAFVRLTLGGHEIDFKTAKLTKLTIELRAGGVSHLSMAVEAEAPLNTSLTEIIERLNQHIECEIRADDPNAQKDLPLSKHGEGEEPEQKRRGRGRRFGRGMH